MPETKPRLLITTGDPNGIGPEIALKAVVDERVLERSHPVLIGCPEVLGSAARLLGMKNPIRICTGDEEVPRSGIPVIVPDGRPYKKVAAGRIEARAGTRTVRDSDAGLRSLF